MKRILPFVLAVAMVAISCTKESKEEPYNPDGSPITQAQALEIVKEDIDEYDLVFISKSIVDKGTKIDTFFGHNSAAPIRSRVACAISTFFPTRLTITLRMCTGNTSTRTTSCSSTTRRTSIPT